MEGLSIKILNKYMVGIMDGESLRTQGARFGRAGSFFAENVRKPEKISFGRLVINKINNQGGLRKNFVGLLIVLFS